MAYASNTSHREMVYTIGGLMLYLSLINCGVSRCIDHSHHFGNNGLSNALRNQHMGELLHRAETINRQALLGLARDDSPGGAIPTPTL